jgi:hypothetical protein
MTPEIRDQIIDRMHAGESLSRICADENMPSKSAVYRFLNGEGEEHDEFRRKYDRAWELRYRYLAEEILDIADDAEDDYEERINENGEHYVALNRDNISRAVLRVKARQWMLERIVPHKYGRTTKIVGDPDAPVTSNFTIMQVNFNDLPPEEIKLKTLPGGFRRVGQEEEVEVGDDI